MEKFQFKEYNFTEEDLIKNIGQGCNDEELFQFSLQENFSYLKILAPPVSSCKFCFRKLTQVRGKATQVVFFSQDGPIPASKFDYRCRGCPIENEGIPIDEKSDVIYSPTMFGTKTQGMRFYEESVGYTMCVMLTIVFWKCAQAVTIIHGQVWKDFLSLLMSSLETAD